MVYEVTLNIEIETPTSDSDQLRRELSAAVRDAVRMAGEVIGRFNTSNGAHHITGWEYRLAVPTDTSCINRANSCR